MLSLRSRVKSIDEIASNGSNAGKPGWNLGGIIRNNNGRKTTTQTFADSEGE